MPEEIIPSPMEEKKPVAAPVTAPVPIPDLPPVKKAAGKSPTGETKPPERTKPKKGKSDILPTVRKVSGGATIGAFVVWVVSLILS